MKQLVAAAIVFTALTLWAMPGTVTDIHIEDGDTALYARNIDTVTVDLNIGGTHLWDFTDEAITWDEIPEHSYHKQASEGMFGGMFPEAEIVSQTISAVDTAESYIKKTDELVIAYGFTTVREGQASPSVIGEGKVDTIMKFPSTLGDTRYEEYTMSAGPAVIYVKAYEELIDTGQVLTELDTFHCVLLRLYEDIEVKVMGVTVALIKFYRYDWYVDNLTSVATIQSRDDEVDPNFTQAVRVSRVKELSYYVPAVAESEPDTPPSFHITQTNAGLKIRLQMNEAGEASLVLYDVAGREVGSRRFSANRGINEFYWETELPKGVYIASLKTYESETNRKLMILR